MCKNQYVNIYSEDEIIYNKFFLFHQIERRIKMTKLKNFLGTKNGKIAVGAIALAVIVAITGVAIALKHKSKSNLTQNAKTESALDVKKAEEAIEKADAEEKAAEEELAKSEKGGNSDEIEKAKAKVDEAKRHTLKAKSEANKENNSSNTTSTSKAGNQNKKADKKSEAKPSKPNKPNKPKETLAQEIARLKAWVRESHPNAIFLPNQYPVDYNYEKDVRAYARSKGIIGFGFSDIELSNGKCIPFFWKH